MSSFFVNKNSAVLLSYSESYIFIFSPHSLPDASYKLLLLNKCISKITFPKENIYTYYLAGYRHVPLRTENCTSMPLGTLFVHITLKSYVPEGYGGKVKTIIAHPCFSPRRTKNSCFWRDNLVMKHFNIRPQVTKSIVFFQDGQNLNMFCFMWCFCRMLKTGYTYIIHSQLLSMSCQNQSNTSLLQTSVPRRWLSLAWMRLSL
jgi:hypothetical protein